MSLLPVSRLVAGYGFTRINIADDLFTSDKVRVYAFCAELKRRGIKIAWSAFARVNTVDAEVLAVMRGAGCDTVSFGIESGNAEMLKRVKKGGTLQQLSDAGYIKPLAGAATTRWYWTHNNRSDSEY